MGIYNRLFGDSIYISFVYNNVCMYRWVADGCVCVGMCVCACMCILTLYMETETFCHSPTISFQHKTYLHIMLSFT